MTDIIILGLIFCVCVFFVVIDLLLCNARFSDNWHILKKIIREKQDYYSQFKDNRYRKFLSELLDKMEELEKGSGSK